MSWRMYSACYRDDRRGGEMVGQGLNSFGMTSRLSHNTQVHDEHQQLCAHHEKDCKASSHKWTAETKWYCLSLC